MYSKICISEWMQRLIISLFCMSLIIYVIILFLKQHQLNIRFLRLNIVFFNPILNTNFVLFLWLLVGTVQSILWYHLQKGKFSEPNASDYPLRTPLGVLASKSLLSITPQKQRPHVSAVKHLSNMNEVFCTMPPPHCIDMYNSN